MKSDPPPAPPAPDPTQPPEQDAPAKGHGGWGPQYDYGLLDPEMDGFDGDESKTGVGQDAPYGAFDLIEMEPQDVGGKHKEEERR